MSNDHQVAPEASAPGSAPSTFTSLTELRAEHIALMRTARDRENDRDLLADVHAFIDRAQAAGRWIDSPADREAAQNIITYWTSYQFSAGDREALSATLPALDPFDPSHAPDLTSAANPYIGLNPFDEDDAGRFFGREEAVRKLLEQLREQRAVLVSGPMGSGKTSIVMAGVIPRMKSQLAGEGKSPLVLVVVPRADPFAALLASIHEVAADPALPKLETWITEQKQKLERSPETFGGLLDGLFPGRPVIMVVDQLEQIFTICSDEKTREGFVQALIGTRGQPDRTILIIEERYQQPALQLAALKSIGENPAARFSLGPPNAAEVQHIIESAATTVGLKFDEGIVEDLAKNVAGDAGALAMLQFTLGRLWHQRQRNRITWEAYHKVGKPRDALIRTAETIYAGLTSDDQAAARCVFLQLVQPDVEGFIRRRVRRDVLVQIAPAGRVDHVLERYVDAELVRRSPGVGWDDDRFDLAHSALIDGWPRLRDWLQEERDRSKAKLQLIATAQRWQASGFDAGYLLSGAALDDAASYMEGAPELKELVAASRTYNELQARRYSRARNGALIVMATLLVVAVSGWLKAFREEQSAQKSAQSAFSVVGSVLDVIQKQLNTGEIRVSNAGRLLSGAEKIYDAVEKRPEFMEYRAKLLTKSSDVYLLVGDHRHTVERIEEAKNLTDQLLAKDAENDEWQELRYEVAFRIGDAFEGRDLKRSAAELDYALRIAQKLADKNPADSEARRRIAFVENKIADSLLKKDWNGALDWYRKSLAIGTALLAQDPNDPDAQKAVADARTRIGDVLAAHDRLKEALAEYEQAMTIREALVRRESKNNVYRSNLSKIYEQVGRVHKMQGQPDDALKYFQMAVDLSAGLARDDPDNVDWKIRLARQYVIIGDSVAEQDPAGAIDRYRSALAIREEVTAKDLNNVAWTRDVADAHDRLGSAWRRQHDFVNTLREYDAGLQIRLQLATRFPDDGNRQLELAEGYERIGDAAREQSEPGQDASSLQDAVEAYRKGLVVVSALIAKNPNSGAEKVRDRLQAKLSALTTIR
ncbi:TPR repeat-containing protein [Bradyrhizobium oligotrophicum S58]|uniref:TPR repeat-containing protein n=1 Tax=Bradyrhizobium oligotrophicum S58 TaxID=1245469 RepID=M4ZWC9_9BRAD|nr:AAA family ATPase [Bradyrhizobium oligotrophicum]BAM90640.1 TPR repeat-containing protein [Bradyrhizobium oligotrophicum S58]